MSGPIELTEITIIQKDTANKIRQANISGFEEPVFYGVHGGVIIELKKIYLFLKIDLFYCPL